MKRFERNKLFTTIDNYKSIKYTFSVVPEIMKMLGLDYDRYAIGGSVAALIYGIDINRVPHDVDIIVAPGMLKQIEERVNKSPFFIKSLLTASTDVEYKTIHFAFSTCKGMYIDIIEWDKLNDKDNTLVLQTGESTIRVVRIEHLIASKRNYYRPKDYEDLPKLESLYNELKAQSDKEAVKHSLPKDEDAVLAELKAKMGI